MPVVVEGERSWSGGGIAFAAVVVAGIGEIVLAENKVIPSILSSSAVGALMFVAAIGLSFFVWRRSIARAGRVVMGVSAIHFTRGRAERGRRMDLLLGLPRRGRGLVELIRAPVLRDFPRLTIPTPSESDRVAVLEALDRHGLRRVE